MASAQRMMVCMGAMVVLAMIAASATSALRITHDKKLVGNAGSVGKVLEEGCPEEDYAYPFQSVCQEPATFETEYHLVAPFSNALIAKGGLSANGAIGRPVSFTANASDEGLRFTLTPLNSAAANVTLGTAFTITNTETGMKIGWQFSAWHRTTILTFLWDASPVTEFQLAPACRVPLPCPETTGARCESYYLLTAGFTGLNVVSPRDEPPSWNYIVPAPESLGNMPLLLRRVDTDANIRSLVPRAA